MRPVNLLPQSERASRPAEGLGGSSYVVLGVLGALLLAVVAFVVTQNQVNGRTTEIAKAQAEQQEATQRAASLGAFGSFASVKEQREKSVRELAKARFDWERFMRELALVLPTGTSLLDATASTNDAPEAGGAAATPAPAAPAGSPPAASTPTVKLTGCAVSQPRVATLLVRLRNLAGATEVELTESVEEETGSGGGGAVGADSASADNTTCPPGKFKFDVLVTFAGADAAVEETKPRKTPARLGGGA